MAARPFLGCTRALTAPNAYTRPSPCQALVCPWWHTHLGVHLGGTGTHSPSQCTPNSTEVPPELPTSHLHPPATAPGRWPGGGGEHPGICFLAPIPAVPGAEAPRCSRPGPARPDRPPLRAFVPLIPARDRSAAGLHPPAVPAAKGTHQRGRLDATGMAGRPGPPLRAKPARRGGWRLRPTRSPVPVSGLSPAEPPGEHRAREPRSAPGRPGAGGTPPLPNRLPPPGEGPPRAPSPPKPPRASSRAGRERCAGAGAGRGRRGGSCGPCPGKAQPPRALLRREPKNAGARLEIPTQMRGHEWGAASETGESGPSTAPAAAHPAPGRKLERFENIF